MINLKRKLLSALEKPNENLAQISLVIITLFWGYTFVLVKEGVSNFPVMLFLFCRFGLASIIVGFLTIPRLKSLNVDYLKKGSFIGLWLFLGYFFQTWGITFTSASSSGFITGLFVVLTPIVSFFYLKRKIHINVIISVILAVSGLLLLSLKDMINQNAFLFNIGDLLTLFCALAYAIHICSIDKHSPNRDAGLLTFVQLSTVAVLSLIFHLIVESPPKVFPPETIKAILITSILATCLAIWMQTKMQKYTSPAKVAIIFTLEPLFAALFAFLLLGENIGLYGYLGGLLIISSMFIAEINKFVSKRFVS